MNKENSMQLVFSKTHSPDTDNENLVDPWTTFDGKFILNAEVWMELLGESVKYKDCTWDSSVPSACKITKIFLLIRIENEIMCIV